MSEITLTSEITVRPIQSMGGDHMVVASAKVSTCGEDAERFADPEYAEGNAGLINYLMRYRHGTPFEHSAVTFFAHCPIFVWREWRTHRIGFAYQEMEFSYNEESARYRPLSPTFWIPRRDRAMVPVGNWKPSRPKFMTLDEAVMQEVGDTYSRESVKSVADTRHHRVVGRLETAYCEAYRQYEAMLSEGIASEVARAVLPVGIYSSCWVTCNPRSLMAFLSLRTHEPDATFPSYPQAEIEEAARAAEETLKQGWPITYAAFNKYGRVAP